MGRAPWPLSPPAITQSMAGNPALLLFATRVLVPLAMTFALTFWAHVR
jgi:hypothetical protein